MKVKHNQRFFIINNETYTHYYAEHIREHTKKDYTFINYEWVIPMYVYAINQIWNGEERFDLSPVNFAIKKNQIGDSWRWKREYKYSDIGKDIYNTKDEALKVYNEKFSLELRNKYKDIHQLKELKS